MPSLGRDQGRRGADAVQRFFDYGHNEASLCPGLYCTCVIRAPRSLIDTNIFALMLFKWISSSLMSSTSQQLPGEVQLYRFSLHIPCLNGVNFYGDIHKFRRYFPLCPRGSERRHLTLYSKFYFVLYLLEYIRIFFKCKCIINIKEKKSLFC